MLAVVHGTTAFPAHGARDGHEGVSGVFRALNEHSCRSYPVLNASRVASFQDMCNDMSPDTWWCAIAREASVARAIRAERVSRESWR